MAANYRKIIGTTEGLRRGITTGTTAAAAAKAAAVALLSGQAVDKIDLRLPKSNKSFSCKEINIPVNSCELNHKSTETTVSASVLKDSGDDKDDTNGIEIFAFATATTDPGINIEAGEGIGRVTGTGLAVKPGNPAINPVPKKMIQTEVQQVIDRFGLPDGVAGLKLVFSAPKGCEIAAKTWNSRIGVEGGISIIGTCGVVEPRSEKAYRASIGLVIKAASLKRENFTVISGYVGEKFLQNLGADENGRVAVGDLIGFALGQCARRGIKQLFLPLHIGKLTKIAAGLFNTHCDFGDARLETLAAVAGSCGASPAQINRLLELQLAEDAISLLQEWQIEQTFTIIAERAKFRCIKYLEKEAAKKNLAIPRIETAALDLKGELLGWSGSYKTPEELCRNFM